MKRSVWNRGKLYPVSVERIGALLISGEIIQGHKTKDFEMKRDINSYSAGWIQLLTSGVYKEIYLLKKLWWILGLEARRRFIWSGSSLCPVQEHACPFKYLHSLQNLNGRKEQCFVSILMLTVAFFFLKWNDLLIDCSTRRQVFYSLMHWKLKTACD